MSTSPDLGVPFISGGQAQPEVTHNEAVLLLQVMQSGVIDRAVNTPAVGPTIGDAYIVGAAPTGAWAGRANTIAVWNGSAWRFIPGQDDAGTPITMGARQEGMRIWVRDENALYAWDGSAWTAFASTPPAPLDYGQRAISLNTTAIVMTAAVDPTLATNTDYAQVTGIWNAPPDGQNSGITQQANSFTIAKSGVYRIEFWAAASSNVNNTQIAVKFAVNGVLGLQRRPKIFMRGAGEVHGGAAFGYAHFTAGDVITLWIASTQTANIVIEDCVFGATSIKYD